MFRGLENLNLRSLLVISAVNWRFSAHRLPVGFLRDDRLFDIHHMTRMGQESETNRTWIMFLCVNMDALILSCALTRCGLDGSPCSGIGMRHSVYAGQLKCPPLWSSTGEDTPGETELNHRHRHERKEVSLCLHSDERKGTHPRFCFSLFILCLQAVAARLDGSHFHFDFRCSCEPISPEPSAAC